MDNKLVERTFAFSVMVLDFLEKLPITNITTVIITQLAKSATSIGANYEEAQRAHSKEDFYFKIGICLREARKSNYWLRLVKSKKWAVENTALSTLIEESDELKLIFGKIFSSRATKN